MLMEGNFLNKKIDMPSSIELFNW